MKTNTLADTNILIRWAALPLALLGVLLHQPLFHWAALAVVLFWAVLRVRRTLGRPAEQEPAGKPRSTHLGKQRQQQTADAETLHRINQRVRGLLVGTYPHACWCWHIRPTERTARIRPEWSLSLAGAGPYTCANAAVDITGRLTLTLFSYRQMREDSSPPALTAAARSVVSEELEKALDRSGWADLRQCLKEAADQGHSALCIHEKGDVVVTMRGREMPMGRVRDFPARERWDCFTKLFQGSGITVEAAQEGLVLHWEDAA